MTYVITTQRRTTTPEGFDPPPTRITRPTLDEARDYVKDYVVDLYDSDAFDPNTWTYPDQYFEAADELTEEGGTIGPLPYMGIVITVAKEN